MSASREKKARQQLHASGYVDPKVVKAEEERKATKRANTLYAIICAAFVLVAAFTFVWNSGVLQHKATAATVDGKNYTVEEVGYFYHSAYNQWYQQMGAYASYFGLDVNSPLDAQMYDEEAGMTWADYFVEEGMSYMKWVLKAYDEAVANGVEWTAEDDALFAADKASMSEYAAANGISYKELLKYNYGTYITEATYEKYVKMETVANRYAQSVNDAFSFDLSAIEEYYSANKLDFDVADYEMVTVSGTVATKDADGNEVEVTDKMKEEAMAAAKATAEVILAAVQEGIDLETASENQENATYSDRSGTAYSKTDILEWVFDDSRVANDATVIEGTSDYTVVVFHNRGRQDYNTVDVRHILVKVDSSELDKESETYESDLEALKAAAKAEADGILAQWNSGAKTEESFAALADELTDDSGSKGNGGLYTEIAKGDMVTEFNDWIFDETRKTGDAEVIYAESTGYHVMYFVGENIAYWQRQVDDTLRSNAYSEWYDGLVADVTVELGSGVKYVKN